MRAEDLDFGLHQFARTEDRRLALGHVRELPTELDKQNRGRRVNWLPCECRPKDKAEDGGENDRRQDAVTEDGSDEAGLRITAAGLLVGLFGAAGVAQLLSSLLFGISPFDPITYLTIAAVLFTVATLACWLPARRAANTDPVVALRAE